ncbi:MAG TPA: vitamin K epoxide reductase family protein [Pseudomonadales bacterium]
MKNAATDSSRPVVVITGANGNVGAALTAALLQTYDVVRCDRPGKDCDIPLDISSDASVAEAVQALAARYAGRIAAVVHLAAYFDFTGEDSPLYQSVNVEGTRRLVRELSTIDAGRFVYASTMLVHEPAQRGLLVSEATPLRPKWAYPQSKAEAERVIADEHRAMPYTILRLAGMYDDETGVPTLTQQIARIYERNFQSHLYAGDPQTGQSFIHKQDMVDVFKRVIDQRAQLPVENVILAGEPDVMGYDELQDAIGKLLHGDDDWKTLVVPGPVAKAGAWVQDHAESVIPDSFDEGHKPFIKPFMIDLASDHYALDISRARQLLGWQPRHSIRATLPKMIAALKRDPVSWYTKNKIPLPPWMESAQERERNPELVRRRYDADYAKAHHDNLWAHFLNIGLGFWLISAPFTLGYESRAMVWSDVISGVLIVLLGLCALSPGRWMRMARFDLGLVGLWLLFAPLIFWAPTAAEYLNGTIIGALVIGFALLTRPFPLMSPAASAGPEIPPGWDFSPSSWFQRIPIIALAFVGFYISRYLTAYQLGHIDSVWEPFFAGDIPGDGKNGTEEIITSSVSEAWPVPDAGLGALTYMLEILTGLIGSASRWRTMPWLVLLFGIMIIPLGFISMTFIIIQPIMLGTWCTLCLIAALAMLLQIPYSFDEIMATIGFLRRRARAGRPWIKVLFTGDTDEGSTLDKKADDFRQPFFAAVRNVVGGGINVPWNLAVCLAIGVWLLLTRVTLGTSGDMANADHVIGSLVLTVTLTAFAEVVRAARLLNVLLGLALIIAPFVLGADTAAMVSSLVCGAALIAFSIRRGPVRNAWGEWTGIIV